MSPGETTVWESESTCESCRNVAADPNEALSAVFDDPGDGIVKEAIEVPLGETVVIIVDEDDDDDDEWPVPIEPIASTARLISHSEVQTFKRCRRKWWLGWHRHLRLKHERPVGPLAIGTWVHEALAAHYTPESPPPMEVLAQILERTRVEMMSVLSEKAEEDADGGFDATALLVQHDRDAELARAMVEGYVQWIEESGADVGLDIVGVEEYIEADIERSTSDGVPVKIIGKLDARMRREHDQVRFFMDHKTVGDFVQPVKTIHMNEQMLHYMLLERMQLHDEPVVGALYNMLRKVKRTGNAKPPFYQRVEVRHNPTEIESYARHLDGMITDMLAVEAALNQGADHHAVAWPTPRRDCGFDCEFLPVCNLLDDGSRAEDMIEQLYRVGFFLDHYGVVQAEKVLDA